MFADFFLNLGKCTVVFWRVAEEWDTGVVLQSLSSLMENVLWVLFGQRWDVMALW